MLIRACTIIRIQPFDQQFFCPLKSHCFQSKTLKIKLMKLQKNEANFADSRWFCSLFCFQCPHSCAWGRGVCSYNITLWSAGWHKGVTHGRHSTLYYYYVLYYYWLFEILPPYTIISPYALLLIFVDLATLYHYFALYYIRDFRVHALHLSKSPLL